MMALPMAVMAAGSVIGGIAQNSQAKQQASIEDANAKLDIEQSQSDAAALKDRAVRLHGQQMAQAGASGISGVGFADAIRDSDIESTLDQQKTLWNGKLRAEGARAQAAAARSSGDAALTQGLLGAGSKALSAYAAWKQPDRYGAY